MTHSVYTYTVISIYLLYSPIFSTLPAPDNNSPFFISSSFSMYFLFCFFFLSRLSLSPSQALRVVCNSLLSTNLHSFFHDSLSGISVARYRRRNVQVASVQELGTLGRYLRPQLTHRQVRWIQGSEWWQTRRIVVTLQIFVVVLSLLVFTHARAHARSLACTHDDSTEQIFAQTRPAAAAAMRASKHSQRRRAHAMPI